MLPSYEEAGEWQQVPLLKAKGKGNSGNVKGKMTL